MVTNDGTGGATSGLYCGYDNADIRNFGTVGDTGGTPIGITLDDFGASASNKIVFGNAAFRLELTGANNTPKLLPGSLFVANTTGAVTKPTQRFAYDTKNGELFFDKDGSGSASHQLVATLTGAPHLAAADLFFIS